MRPKLEQFEHPMSVLTRPSLPTLPSYLLYGEHGGPAEAERLHVETISARSQLHDWEIQPHRHHSFFQILYMAHGRAQASLDGVGQPLLGPCVVLVPALVAHGFVFEPGVQGQVITVQQAHLMATVADAPGLWALCGAAQHLALARRGEPARELAAAVSGLVSEYTAHRPWRGPALDTGLRQLMLVLARALPADAGRVLAQRAPDHLGRYTALIESRFRLQPRVADLAAELGITPTQLNRICRATLGRPALRVLHDRVVLEAQRQLAYTQQSIKRIGLDLGFTDAGYFTRFFQRHCGASPSDWRDAAHR
jgi:AraC family transcriptional regulator, transcriptional activator of pobA